MALKDWDVIQQSKYGILYKNKNNGDVVGVSWRNLKVVNIYDESGRLMFEKETKTKTQAMKHARDYMKNN